MKEFLVRDNRESCQKGMLYEDLEVAMDAAKFIRDSKTWQDPEIEIYELDFDMGELRLICRMSNKEWVVKRTK